MPGLARGRLVKGGNSLRRRWPASQPSFKSCASTAPSRPRKTVYVGTPNKAASLFIVPPAPTTRSAFATSESPSTAVFGTVK